MLYNKNQFKKVNDKKVLHKIKKHWVTISVALLGLIGVKSVAMHTNASANAINADNPQANHQLNSQSIKSTASLVPNKGASVTSTHSAPSSQASSSSNASISSTSAVQHTYNSSSASYSVASSNNSSSANKSQGIPSEAQQIHNQILNEFVDNNQASQTKAKHLLGGAKSTPQVNNNSIMGQLMNIMHNNIQNGTNETGAKQAYSDLMNFISPSNLAYMSSHEIYAAKGTSLFGNHPIGGDPNWLSYMNRIQSDLTKINANGKSNRVLKNIISRLKGITDELNGDSFLIAKKQLNLDEIGTRFDTNGTVHSMLLGMVNNNEQKLDHIASIIHTVSHISSNNTLKNDYSNVVNDLNKLPNQSKADQVNTLHDLSNHISTFAGDISTQGNGYLPSQDKQYFSGITSNLTNASQSVSNESSKLNQENNEETNANNELNSYKIGSLFNDAVTYTINHNDYAKLNSVANDAKGDFANTTSADSFINTFVGQLTGLKNANAPIIEQDLNDIKANPATNDAYTVAKANANDANNILDDLANLNANNAANNLSNVSQTISDNGSLNAVGALNDIADSASTEATSVSNSESAAVNTLVAGLPVSAATSYVASKFASSGFNKAGQFDDLINQAKTAFDNGSNASAFLTNFANEAKADFNANDDDFINNALTSLESNSAVSDAYGLLQNNKATADNILSDLGTMSSGNTSAALNNVATEINNNPSLKNVSAISTAATLATSAANSASANNAYKGLLNNESTLFSGIVNRINANGFKSAAFNTLVGNVKHDLANAANVSDFANDLNGQAGAFNGVTAQDIKGYLNNLKNNPEFSNAYQAVRTSSAAADSILDDLSGMNSANEVAKLSNIANVASTNFSNSASFGSLATDAANMQTSVSGTQSTAASMAYSSLLTNHESGLFDAMVNRINASGFNSAAFKTLVGNAENDLAQASNASDFVNSLASQDGVFDGVTAKSIKNDLTAFANNPEFSNAYRAVRNSSAAADSILNDLSGMNSDNEVAKLSDIANVASTNFSNSASFGSLATDADDMKNTVSGQQRAAQTASAAAVNGLVNNVPVSAALSFVASKFASSGFSKAIQFDNLIAGVKNAFDNPNDSNAMTFLTQFSDQVKDAFPAADGLISGALNNLESNPTDSSAVNDTYSLFRNNKQAADNILSDFATLEPETASESLNNVEQTVHDTSAFSAISAISNAAESAATDATSASNSSVKSGIAKGVVTARQNATDASNDITAFQNEYRNLPSNADGKAASADVQQAITDANTAKSWATQASNDAETETGVSVPTAGFGAAAPQQYVEDEHNAEKYQGYVTNDLSAARREADNSRTLGNVDQTLKNLHVGTLFSSLLNYVVAHDDYGKLSTVVNDAKDSFNHNGDVSNFVSQFLGQVTGYQNVAGIKDALNGHKSELETAYGVAKNHSNDVNDILGNLSNLNADNFTQQLTDFQTALKGNNTFNQMTALTDVANNAGTEASQINTDKSQINGLVNDVLNSGFIRTAVEKLVHEPANKRNAFETLAGANGVQKYLTNDNDVASFIHDAENNDNFNAFSGRHASQIKSLLNRLNNNDTTFKAVVNSYYNNVKANASKVDDILDKLSDLAANPYSKQTGVNDLNGIRSDASALQNVVPGMNAIATHINSNSYQPATNVDTLVEANDELNNVPVNTLFTGLMNYVISNNDYPKLNQVARLAKNDFGHDSDVSSFVNDFVNQVSGYSNGGSQFIRQYLKNNDLNAAYQVAKDNSTSVNSILDRLTNINSNNVATNLGMIRDDIKYNGMLNQLNELDQVASTAADEASQVNNVNSMVNGLIQPNFVSNAVTKLANEPANKRTAFVNLMGNVQDYLANDNDVTTFVSDVDGDNNFKAFTGNTAGSFKGLLTNLTNSSLGSVLNGYYDQIKAQKDSVDGILTDLENIAKDPYQQDNQVASALTGVQNIINGSQALQEIPGFTNVANGMHVDNANLPKKPNKPVTISASVESLVTLMPSIVNGITKANFNNGQFNDAIQAVEDNLDASNLSDLWTDIKDDPRITAFTNRHGNVTDSITDLLNSNNNTIKALNAAYQQVHTDGNVGKILNDLKTIASNHKDANDKSASSQSVDTVKNALNNVADIIQDDGTLNGVAGMSDVMNKARSEANAYNPQAEPPKSVAPIVSLPITQDLVNVVLNRLTDPSFAKGDFDNAVKGTDGIESALASQSTLSGFFNMIKNNRGVANFNRRSGGITDQVMSILNNGQYEGDYEVAHNDAGNVDNIFNKLDNIAQSPLDNYGDNNQIDTDLSDIAGIIHNDQQLRRIGGMQIVGDTALDDDHNYQTSSHNASVPQANPHYSGNTDFNKILTGLVNNPYTIQKLADHLASTAFAQSGERSAFNGILRDLENLPDSSNVNGDLSNISALLGNFQGPLSKPMAEGVQGLISKVEAHDTTPRTLAGYADQIGGAKGALINDLNAGMQSVKAGQSNADYQHVLNDVIDLDSNPAHEAHDLNQISKVINHGTGDLKNIPLLKNVAYDTRHAAKQINTNQKHIDSDKRNDAEQQQQNDALRHQQYEAAKQQQQKDNAKRSRYEEQHKQNIARRQSKANAEQAQHNQDVARHNKRQADNAQHNKDVARHNRREAAQAATSAAADATNAVTSAVDAQDVTSGLSLGNASNKAKNAANNVMRDAANAKADANNAQISAHKAMTDVNNNDIINDANDARTAAGKALAQANAATSDLRQAKTFANQAGKDGPHYSGNKNFNRILTELANNPYTVKTLADHLASKAFAQSGERSAFNGILRDLASLPDSPNVNNDLSDISNLLNNFQGPLSKAVAGKVQSMINNVKAHDETPSDVAIYADQLGGNQGALINDLNKGIQDVKSGQNNADYQKVLNDLIDLDTSPKHEDHDLNDIAKVINSDSLRKIPLLANVAASAHQVARAENSTRRHNNRKQQSNDAKRHAKYEADQKQHNKDVQRHAQAVADQAQQKRDSQRHTKYEAAQKQHKINKARHSQIMADKKQQQKDGARHQHYEAAKQQHAKNVARRKQMIRRRNQAIHERNMKAREAAIKQSLADAKTRASVEKASANNAKAGRAARAKSAEDNTTRTKLNKQAQSDQKARVAASAKAHADGVAHSQAVANASAAAANRSRAINKAAAAHQSARNAASIKANNDNRNHSIEASEVSAKASEDNYNHSVAVASASAAALTKRSDLNSAQIQNSLAHSTADSVYAAHQAARKNAFAKSAADRLARSSAEAKHNNSQASYVNLISQANSAFGSASSAVALTRADDLFNDQIKAFDFASSAVNGINDEINVYNAEDAELSANSLNSSTVASFSSHADQIADSDVNSIRQYNYYQDLVNSASSVVNVDVMSGDTLSDEETKVDSWSADPIKPTLNFVAVSAPHLLSQSKPRMLLGGMPMFGAESQSNDSFATSAESKMASLNQAMNLLSAANVTNRDQFNSYSNAINSLGVQTRANVNGYDKAQSMSQSNSALIAQGNSEKADAMVLHNRAAGDSLSDLNNKVHDMTNAMNEAKVATSTISKALNNAMIISSAKSASANINDELSQADQAYQNAAKLLSASSGNNSKANNPSGNYNNDASLYASEITSDSNAVTSYSEEANDNLNNSDVANDADLLGSADWCRNMMNSVAANMSDLARSNGSEIASAANYDAIDAELIAKKTYQISSEAESSANASRSSNVMPNNPNNFTPSTSTGSSSAGNIPSTSSNSTSNNNISSANSNRNLTATAAPEPAKPSRSVQLRRSQNQIKEDSDSDPKDPNDGNGQNGALASNTDKGTSAPTANGSYGTDSTDPVEGTGDNENSNASDGRLPQTGESQNTPAMVIMALISLSAALISALGYDLDKDRRRE